MSRAVEESSLERSDKIPPLRSCLTPVGMTHFIEALLDDLFHRKYLQHAFLSSFSFFFSLSHYVSIENNF